MPEEAAVESVAVEVPEVLVERAEAVALEELEVLVIK
jgi:hypothetical protein